MNAPLIDTSRPWQWYRKHGRGEQRRFANIPVREIAHWQPRVRRERQECLAFAVELFHTRGQMAGSGGVQAQEAGCLVAAET